MRIALCTPGSTSTGPTCRCCQATLSHWLHASLICAICPVPCFQVGACVEYVESDGQVIEVSCQDELPRTDFERWDYQQWRISKAWGDVMQKVTALIQRQQQTQQQQEGVGN